MSVTGWAVRQLLTVNVNVVEAAGAPVPDDTVPSAVLLLVTVTVTSAVGSLFNLTVKAASSPSSTTT